MQDNYKLSFLLDVWEMKVGINNIRYNNPTALVKTLKKIRRFNVEIIGMDSNDIGLSAASLMASSYFQTPSVYEEQEYCRSLTGICNNEHIDIIIPGTDDDVYFLSKYKNSIPAIVIVPDEETVKTLNDKLSATIAVSKLGIKTPQMINNLFGEGEIIFRKRISSSSNGVYIVDLKSAKYIKNYFNSDYFIQRLVKGDEYTADVFADINGNPKIIIPRKRLEIKAGMSICSELVCHQSIIDACKQIYSHFHIPGLSNIQFIDDGTGPNFIEINLRFAGSGISGITGSFNYIEQYLDHFVNNVELESFDFYMSKVAWGSIISRYYDEIIYKKQL
jgi:carbamoyl-phosphate synthase large subunit